MKTEKNIPSIYYGDEAPKGKDFLMVLLASLLLIALSWITYFKLGWLH
jgi:hypothetical protein